MQYLDLQEHTFICDFYPPMANQFVRMGRKHMNSSRCGWGQQKRTICSAYEPCYVIQSEHKQVFSDDLMMLTACSDNEVSRSGYFCADDRWQTKPITSPLVHARGLIIISLNQLKSTIYDLCCTTDPLINRSIKAYYCHAKEKINNANGPSVKFKILIPDEPLIQV